ncbi:hypothetical protein [Propionimicrobium sp. PCR01-08-3]|uniref:hypothetical protein n=1 Tax=Propionimicrobium sp. PCR01-08-3 TaxID=3052086 RepID=UPI00255C452E|nr:hypothetical protein [Propionimicrobium sp. PCR01-08-3]WIY82861.1 hypothetical protein QQ658_00415 [Propionimicrobium sp. PCR01-08-3]
MRTPQSARSRTLRRRPVTNVLRLIALVVGLPLVFATLAAQATTSAGGWLACAATVVLGVGLSLLFTRNGHLISSDRGQGLGHN